MPPATRLEELYDAHASGVFHYLNGIVRSEADAKDLLQDFRHFRAHRAHTTRCDTRHRPRPAGAHPWQPARREPASRSHPAMKRFLHPRKLAWAAFTLITLCFLLVAVENWTGARALAAAMARLEHEGESLDFRKLLRPPVPSEANFCALDPLAGITNPDNKIPESLSALNWQQKHSKMNVPVSSALLTGEEADVGGLASYLASIGIGSADAAPAAMLAALDAAHPVLKSLSAAAPLRLEAVFTPALGEGHLGNLMELQVPHYAIGRHLAGTLQARARLAIAAGDAAEAVNSIRAGLRLSQAAAAEPVLIGLLVSAAMHAVTQEGIWALLHARIASDAQLAALQEDFGRLDFDAALLQSMRGELAGITQTIQTMRSSPDMAASMLGVISSTGTELEIVPAHRLIAWLVPRGFWDHSGARIINSTLDGFLQPVKNGGLIFEADGRLAMESEVYATRGLADPHGILRGMSMPAYGGVVRNLTRAEAVRRQSLAAIALERHRLRHQGYPATLAALVPAFLKTVPLDPIDDQPTRYRVTAGGDSFALWSIATDREDDQATQPADGKDITRNTYTGDWVWKMSVGRGTR